MIVLDTNVVSELMRPSPAPSVTAWVDRYSAAELWLTSMTAAELLAGVAVLPDGQRKQQLAAKLNALLTSLFQDRVLPFTPTAAVTYAGILRIRTRAGSPIGTSDAIIAATALDAGADELMTRNIRDFTGIGLELTDPWVA